MRTLVLSLAFGAFALAASTCTSCTSRKPPADTLRVTLGAEPVTLDPAKAEDGVSMKVLGNIMDGLVGYDSEGKLEPMLAESWKVTEAGKHYEFTIRSDARWSDGEPVRAEEFVQAIQRSLQKDTASKLSPLLSAVRDVQAKDGKLVVELSKPVPYFIHAMALTLALPIREDLLRRNSGKWLESFPVTGPYRITEHAPESKIILEKNPYAIRPAKIPKVEMDIVPNESTALHLFEDGKIDIVGKIPDAEFPRLKKQGMIHTDPFLAVYYIAFNVKKAPFDQVENRRAVAASIQNSEIVEALATGEAAATSWLPRGLEGYFPDTFTPKFTDSRLSQFKTRFSALQPVRTSFDSSGRNRLVLEKIQQDVEQKLGLRLSLENMDWKSYIRSLQADATPIFRFAWLAPFNDPIIHLRVFQTGNPNNYSHYSNAEYDRLVEEIASMASGPERERKLRRAQEILITEDAVVIPIYHYVQSHMVAERVQGFRVNPYGIIRFAELDLKNQP